MIQKLADFVFKELSTELIFFFINQSVEREWVREKLGMEVAMHHSSRNEAKENST
jgi:hypothetical protein